MTFSTPGKLAALILLVSAPLCAQHGPTAPAAPEAPAEAKQFAFLIGQFELKVHPAASGLGQKIHGVPTLAGVWKGWRALDGFGIEDEMRITDQSGNPISLVHAVRFYDAVAKRWITSGLDVYRGTFSTSSAMQRPDEMLGTSRGIDGDSKAYVVRSHFYEITPTSFRFRQERSYDDGRTWEEKIAIEARRMAATAQR